MFQSLSVEFPDESLIALLEQHREWKTRNLRCLHFQEEGYTLMERGVRGAEFVKIGRDIPKKTVAAFRLVLSIPVTHPYSTAVNQRSMWLKTVWNANTHPFHGMTSLIQRETAAATAFLTELDDESCLNTMFIGPILKNWKANITIVLHCKLKPILMDKE